MADQAGLKLSGLFPSEAVATDDVKDSSRCPVREAPGNEAYYVPAKDMIAVPPRDSFASNEAFLVTLLHEMGHSTGHPNALGRDLSGTFGSKRYAFEELIAEFSSMFSASDLGLSGDLDPESDHFKQHVAYLQSWQSALEDDPDLLFRAASAAEKATESVIGCYEQHVGHEAPGKEYLKGLNLAEGKDAVSEKKVPAAKETKAVGINELADSVGADDKGTDCSSGVDTLLLTTDRGNAVSIVEECHGAIRADGTEKVTEIEFRQLKPFEAYKTAQLLQSDGLDSAELDSLAANIFMDMDWLQMCTDLAEQMAWECSTERSELAEMLWNGDPKQGIAALADIAVDDDDCIKQEWMGYKPGTPRFEIWKDFETNFSKDGVSLCELSGFDDYKVEYKDPGPTLSESEFDKLFGSDVREGNVQKDVSDVSWDDPGSEDER